MYRKFATCRVVYHTVITGQEEAESLSHIDHQGKAAMVDVGHKSETARHAVASGRVVLGHEAFQAVETNRLAKGDVLSVARVAGIMAAKQTASLIPLCHPLPLNRFALACLSVDSAYLLSFKATRLQVETSITMQAHCLHSGQPV